MGKITDSRLSQDNQITKHIGFSVMVSFSVNLRHYCSKTPHSLSKILAAVKWNSREEVAQVSCTFITLKTQPENILKHSTACCIFLSRVTRGMKLGQVHLM